MARTDRFAQSHPEKDGWYYACSELAPCDLMCCGVKEIHGIQGFHQLILRNRDGSVKTIESFRIAPGDVVQAVQTWYSKKWQERTRPFLIFTENHVGYKRGEKVAGQVLAEYILKHKLGKVFRTGKDYNGNSNNRIELFTWNVDYGALLKHKPVFKTLEAK